jgi:hypothetical protein
MRRDELIKSLETTRNAILESGIGNVVRHYRGAPEPETGVKALRAYAEFNRYYGGFSNSERRIIEIFNLDPLIEPIFWQHFIGYRTDKRVSKEWDGMILKVRWGVIFVEGFVPKIVMLLSQEEQYEPVEVQTKQRKRQQRISTEPLTFFISEAQSPTLPVDGFAQILKAIQNLYDVILKA